MSLRKMDMGNCIWEGNMRKGSAAARIAGGCIMAKLVVPGVILLHLIFSVGETRGGSFVELSEGTPVVVKTTETLNPGQLKEGGKVHLVVAEKVMKEGALLIETGAPVEATVVLVAMEGKETTLLKITGTQAADGEYVVLRMTPEGSGALVDGVDAGQLQAIPLEASRPLPAGTTFTVYLSETYLIEG